MRAVRNEQTTGAVETLLFEIIEFLEHGRDVDDQTRADESDTLWVDQTTRQRVKGIRRLLLSRFVANDDGMTGIVSAGATSTDIGLGGQDVGQFALALVTPLGSETIPSKRKRMSDW